MDRRTLLTGAVALGTTAAVAGGVGAVTGNAVGRTHLDDTVREALGRRGQGSLRVLWSVDSADKVAALTFDDGPDASLTPIIADLLRSYEAVGTFFVLGEMAERMPAMVRDMVAAGHEIANHGQTHVVLGRQDGDEMISGVTDGADTIASIIGTRPRFFRPPHGHVTGAILAGASQSGADVALWSVTRGGPSIADDDVTGVGSHLIEAMQPGAIVCLHDGYGSPDMAANPSASLVTRREAEIAALPRVLAELTDAGWRFVTLSTLVDKHSS